MATDNVQPPPYSQVVNQTKTPLHTNSPPNYNATAPPPYSETNPSNQNPAKTTHSPSRESPGKGRKESFKEVFNPETDQVREKKNKNQRKILVGVGVLLISAVVVVIVFFCCKGSLPPSPQYLLVSSSGGASTSWPMKMGLYNLTKDTYNGYNTYAKVQKCGPWWPECDSSRPEWEDKLDAQVMFVDKFGKWRIYKQLDPALGGVRHPSNSPTPDLPPVEGWLYKSKGEDWKHDVSLRVVERDCWEEGKEKHVRPCRN